MGQTFFIISLESRGYNHNNYMQISTEPIMFIHMHAIGSQRIQTKN
jgi:hypothetical protein